jgi:hypothetical protein
MKTDLLHEFFWENARARGTAYVVTAAIAFLYGVVMLLVFRRSEQRVIYEVIAILLASNVAAVLLYYLRTPKAIRLLESSKTYRLRPLLRCAGVVAFAILLAAPKLSVSAVEAAIVNQRLESAASAVDPEKAGKLRPNQLKTRFDTIASIAATSMRNGVRANPAVVDEARSNIEATLKSMNPSEEARKSGVAAFVAMVAFAQYSHVSMAINLPTILLPGNQGTGMSLVSKVPLRNGSALWEGQGLTIIPTPDPSSEPVFPTSESSVVFDRVNFKGFGMGRSFIGTDRRSSILVMNATIDGASQPLDSIVWLNISFKDSVIHYDGGPLYLGNVTFENCRFEFGADTTSQKVLSQIQLAGKSPVTLVSGL